MVATLSSRHPAAIDAGAPAAAGHAGRRRRRIAIVDASARHVVTRFDLRTITRDISRHSPNER
jgi:hypothetical protein